jgi:hypothetical protein
MLDTGDRRRGLPAGSVDHGDDARPLDTGWTLLRADAVWASNNQDRSAARTPRAPTLLRTGLAPAATVSCRWYAAVQLAPRRTALLPWISMVREEGNETKADGLVGVRLVRGVLMGCWGSVGEVHTCSWKAVDDQVVTLHSRR